MEQVETLSAQAQDFLIITEAVRRALAGGPRSTKNVVTEVSEDVGKSEAIVLSAVHDLISRGTLLLTESWQIRLTD